MLYIFDMGGVVLHGVFELKTILQEQGCSENIMSLYRDDLMDSLSAGLISEDHYWEHFNSRYGTKVESPRWGKTFNPELDLRMTDLVKSLRRHNRVVCGTNTFEAHWQASMDRGDYKAFDKVYASHQMGVAKPDPRFWQTIMEAEGYRAAETVFIDDFIDNVQAAGELGIKSIHFKDIDSLLATQPLC